MCFLLLRTVCESSLVCTRDYVEERQRAQQSVLFITGTANNTPPPVACARAVPPTSYVSLKEERASSSM